MKVLGQGHLQREAGVGFCKQGAEGEEGGVEGSMESKHGSGYSFSSHQPRAWDSLPLYVCIDTFTHAE